MLMSRKIVDPWNRLLDDENYRYLMELFIYMAITKLSSSIFLNTFVDAEKGDTLVLDVRLRHVAVSRCHVWTNDCCYSLGTVVGEHQILVRCWARYCPNYN